MVSQQVGMDRMEALRRILENIHRNKDAEALVVRHATDILLGLNVADGDYRRASEKIWSIFSRKSISDLALLEEMLHETLEIQPEHLSVLMQQRTGLWMSKIIPYLHRGMNTLDLGGGSGHVAAAIAHECSCEVTVADVLDWRREKVAFLPVSDNRVNVPDGCFDQVVVLTVFHHSDDSQALVREAFRLARKRVVFIESVTEDLLMYQYGAWIDWFYNHVVHYSTDITQKIHVPCYFLPATSWEQMVWRLTGLTPSVSKNLGIFQVLNPENHHLFVYDITN